MNIPESRQRIRVLGYHTVWYEVHHSVLHILAQILQKNFASTIDQVKEGRISNELEATEGWLKNTDYVYRRKECFWYKCAQVTQSIYSNQQYIYISFHLLSNV